MEKNINKDRILGIIMLLFTIITIYLTGQIRQTDLVGDPGPRFFPYLGCAVTGICSVVLIFKKPKEKYKPYLTKQQWIRFWTVFGIYTINLICMYIGGYLLSVPITLFLSCLLFSKGAGVPLWKKIVYAIAVTVAIHVLYVVLLKSAMPYGILRWRILW